MAAIIKDTNVISVIHIVVISLVDEVYKYIQVASGKSVLKVINEQYNVSLILLSIAPAFSRVLMISFLC